MRGPLRWFLGMLLRLAFIALVIVALLAGWRALLVYGPGKVGNGKAAMFQFHAKALVRHHLAFPRFAGEVVLPAPAPMSSADVQLRLMQWWDGKNWLPMALAHGVPIKGGLRMDPGGLELVGVTQVGPAETKESLTICRVRVEVRWKVPDDLQEILRVREIVGLRLPKNLTPGQSGESLCTFTQDGWRWRLVSAESPWGGKWDVPLRTLNWMDLIF
jgi:hypothetical protein